MKILIDMSEEEYQKTQDGRVAVTTMRKAILQGTPILDNATNGDIIKALYPRTRDFATGLEYLGVEVRIGEFPSKLTMNVDSDWWNAQYQKK